MRKSVPESLCWCYEIYPANSSGKEAVLYSFVSIDYLQPSCSPLFHDPNTTFPSITTSLALRHWSRRGCIITRSLRYLTILSRYEFPDTSPVIPSICGAGSQLTYEVQTAYRTGEILRIATFQNRSDEKWVNNLLKTMMYICNRRIPIFLLEKKSGVPSWPFFYGARLSSCC